MMKRSLGACSVRHKPAAETVTTWHAAAEKTIGGVASLERLYDEVDIVDTELTAVSR